MFGDMASSDCFLSKQERTLGEVPCQNCGKMVTVLLPFIGCVFCGDCTINDTGQYDGTEDFYDRRREEEHFFGDNIRDAITSLRRT